MRPLSTRVGRVGDGRHARGRGPGGKRLGDRDPAPAARHDEAQERLRLARLLEQRERLGAQRVEVGLQPQARAGAAEAREVVVERERPAAVDAHHLEAAVAAQQPVVGDRDARFRDRARSAPSTLASHMVVAA